MKDSWEDVDFVVTTIMRTCLANEQYFSDLDSVVGDGDFGYSLARGFEKLESQYSDLQRTDIGAFLRQIGVLLTSRIGGTSGPIWGTAFIRAGTAIGGTVTLQGSDVVLMLRAAIAGIQERGGAEVGDKTLLDCLVPITDDIDLSVTAGLSSDDVLDRAAQTARTAADSTADLVAKRGRAAYTGERSRGSVDAGATAIAVIIEQLAQEWKLRETQ
jgi:dihydroxyacetone kinase phosphoprotein-dependent L subunit